MVTIREVSTHEFVKHNWRDGIRQSIRKVNLCSCDDQTEKFMLAVTVCGFRRASERTDQQLIQWKKYLLKGRKVNMIQLRSTALMI